MKRLLPFLIILAVAAAGAVGGVLLYRAKKAELARLSAPVVVADTVVPGAKPPHLRGPKEDADVVLEEFGDFQCPPCAGLARFLDKLQSEYARQVILVFRQFPLAGHQHALQAAAAAEAAGAQGKFWPMHKLLYENHPAWSTADDPAPIFESYAQQIGLDLAAYRSSLGAEAVLKRVVADQQRGKSLGVTSTPTLFINDERVPVSDLNERGIRRAIDDAIAGKKPLFPSANEAKSPSGP